MSLWTWKIDSTCWRTSYQAANVINKSSGCFAFSSPPRSMDLITPRRPPNLSFHTLLLSCAKSHMLSPSRRQPHLLHVSAVDRRQTWSMDKSWRCVTLSGFLHSHIVHCITHCLRTNWISGLVFVFFSVAVVSDVSVILRASTDWLPKDGRHSRYVSSLMYRCQNISRW